MTYPNGIARAAAFDEAGRQTSLAFTDTKATPDPADDTIVTALNYAYDKNGNQTSAREKGLLTYTPPAPHDETSAYTPAGRLQTRTDAADPTGQKNWTYEFKNADGSPSFNLSKATKSDPVATSIELSYDEDNRTTTISTLVAGGTTRLLINRYDALGRRISRRYTTAFASEETHYVLSLTGGMERILADTTPAGTLTALYIHGPDLAVKIDPANPANITCYHPDASGNIVRLTDKDRATVAQYAYSDYGRPFAAAAAAATTDTNPYRFVGSQGVMEEPLLPGLYFMRARYYLADAGVFLSTDPIKNIGPGWKPEAYGYALDNPMTFADPQGTFAFSFRSIVTSVRNFIARQSTSVMRRGGSGVSPGGPIGGKGGGGESDGKGPQLAVDPSPLRNTLKPSPKKQDMKEILANAKDPAKAWFVEQVSINASKQAVTNYLYHEKMPEWLSTIGEKRAGEVSAQMKSQAGKGLMIYEIGKNGVEEFKDRGLTWKDFKEGWRHPIQNLKFGRDNPDVGLKALRDGVNSATAVAINAATGAATGGWLETDLKGTDIDAYSDAVADLIME